MLSGRGDRAGVEEARAFPEAEMRKQDRIRQDVTNRGEQEQPSNRSSSMQPREQERMKGSASTEAAAKPPRQPGKLPLPD